ncbi:MAG: ABC transporter permease [Hyphomicrobiales bacterium]
MAIEARSRSAAPHFPPLLRLSWNRLVVETKIFFRSPEQVFFTFSLPVLLLLLFGAVFSGDIDVDETHSIDFTTYFLPGIIAMGVMSTTFVNLAMSLSVEQKDGLLKRLAGTPLPRSAFFIGRIGSALLVTAIQTALMLAVGRLAFDVGLPATGERWAVFLVLLVLASGVGAVSGIAYTRIIRDARTAAAIVQPPFLVLQFISGVFFRYADVPGWLQAIASVFPLRWIAQGFRYAFLPDRMGEVEYSSTWGWQWPLGITALWLVVSFVLALRFFRWDRQPRA